MKTLIALFFLTLVASDNCLAQQIVSIATVSPQPVVVYQPVVVQEMRVVPVVENKVYYYPILYYQQPQYYVQPTVIQPYPVWHRCRWGNLYRY